MTNLLKELQETDNVSNIETEKRDDITTYRFIYQNLKFTAIHKSGLNLIINIFSLQARIPKAKIKNFNEDNIFKQINTFNRFLKTAKAVIDRIEDKTIVVRFTTEYGFSNDEMFQMIPIKKDLELLVSIYASFTDELNENTGNE